MGDEDALQNTIVFAPRPRTIQEMVRGLARDTRNIKWSKHALQRMDERGITDKYVIDVLRHGTQKGAAEGGNNPGEWKVKMVCQVKGRREVGVVVIMVRNARLFVKTVEWEDLR